MSIPAIASRAWTAAGSCFQPLNKATRIFSNVGLGATTLVGSAAVIGKLFYEPKLSAAKEALKGTIESLKTDAYSEQVEKSGIWYYLSWKGTYTKNHVFTSQEKLENAQAVINRFLNPTTEQSPQGPTKSAFLSYQLAKIDAKLKEVKGTEPALNEEQQKEVVTNLIANLEGVQENFFVKNHSEKAEKYGAIGLASAAVFFAALRLGVPQAFLRAVRVMS
ncbi:MAG: hypothetical protein AB7F31_03745 [Parachlamydiales bacterium]